MALVFKVRYGNTLRRWTVCDTIDAESFCLTFQRVDQRIRELFDLSPSAVLVITYIDKENDVITIADDKDLVDACIVQRLNPLRLEVQVCDGVPDFTSQSSAGAFPKLKDDISIEAYLHAIFSEGTENAIKQIINTHAPVVDLKLPVTTLLQSMHGTLQELLQKYCRWAEKQNCPETKETGRQKCQTSSVNGKKEHDGNKSSQLHDWTPCGGSKCGMSPIQAVHHGVQCDNCGVYPIEGPRFKSMKIHNYDLCLSCFQSKGNETDYHKIEHPIHAPPLHGCHPWQCPRGPRPFMGSHAWRSSFTRGPYGWKSKCPFISQQIDHEVPSDDNKILDARFVEDVTVSDGTEFAQGIKFTKIWRLKNSGLMVIPESTKLVHVSGDILSSESMANLELPEGGVPCGQNFDASIDFVAPSKEGRYISYWQLLSPSGQKFGHRLWVEFQVVPQCEESLQHQGSLSEEAAMIDAPAPGDGERVPMSKDVSSFDPMGINVEGSMNSDSSERTSSSDGVVIEEWQSKQNPLFDRDVDGFSMIEIPMEAPSEQLTDAFKETPDVLDAGEMSQADGQEHDVLAAGDTSRVNEHLQILETMGFTNRDLNIVLLDKNNQNIQQTLDDLLVSAGWDEVLKDLEEMGFDDRLTNIRLVVKNVGSLKRVVKDLLDMEKKIK